MRSLLLLVYFIFTLLVGYNNISYGTDFSYDIDRFMQMGSGVTFVDEFDDDLEPPIGPGGSTDYFVFSQFSPTAESGGLLNLNSNDTQGSDYPTISASCGKSASFIRQGFEGLVQGKFKLTNGINVNTSLGIAIFNNGPRVESVYLETDKSPSGKVMVFLYSDVSGIETDISESDITNLLIGVTDLTLRLDVSVAGVVTASLDFGSDGSFELVMSGSHPLVFITEKDYTGNFSAFSYSDLIGDFVPNPDGSIGLHINNDYGENIPVEWKLWAEFGATKIPIINLGSDGSFILPSLFDLALPLFPPGLPSGLTIGSRFIDPITGQEFCVDTLTIP